MTDWASLERGLLRDIFTRLSDADGGSFRCVCRPWRVAAGAGKPVFRPWFIVQSHGAIRQAYLHHAGRRRVRAVTVEDTVVNNGQQTGRATVMGASRGWLAVSEGTRLLLRDPISRAEVPLPALGPAHQLFDIFLSDDPLAAPGRWTAFAFLRRIDCLYAGHSLAFYRPGGDDEWARIDAGEHGQAGHQIRLFRGFEFVDGRAYVLLGDYSVAVCDVEARRLVVSSVRLDSRYHNGPEWQVECLVECGGDLLFAQVARSFAPVRRPPSCLGRTTIDETFAARVIRIGLAADGSGTPVEASDAEEVGDYALFLAPHGHAFALPASGFPAVSPGCVYHFNTDLPRMTVAGMVISDLRESPHRHETVRKLPLAGEWRPLAWFCPRRPILGTPSKRSR